MPEPTSSDTLSFISSVVDRSESHVAALSYFLMNDLGIPRDKLTSIALKFPEVYSLDLENSLNSSQILVELLETEKIFEIFMEDNAKRVGRLIDLAIDCSNSFN